MGIHCFLQLDNQLSCRGSNRYPRSFGLVIRLCLLLGVEPIFIPLGEGLGEMVVLRNFKIPLSIGFLER